MPTPLPGEGVLSYRVGQLEHSNASLHKKVDRILDKMNEKDVAHGRAVERCSAWGEQIEKVREEDIPTIHRRIDAVQGSSGAIAASNADASANATGRTFWDALWHPATPIAFALLSLIVVFVVYVSAQTGRSANSLIPSMSGSGVGSQDGGK